MCGIVGLHLKRPELRPRLGAYVAGMLASLADRGPDSAGIALYDDPLTIGTRYSVRAVASDLDWEVLARDIKTAVGSDVTVQRRAGDAVLIISADEREVLATLRVLDPVRLVGYGRAIEVYKAVGSPTAICERYGIADRGGYQALGHTRMATESAVTTDHSHPFAPAPDLCLVHNGSFSNYASIRRKLQRQGETFDTDNDSEVAARFLARQLREGYGLENAMHLLLERFDGFFTLLVATRDSFAVLRDTFVCKPAVIAQTDDYVAVASEFQALARLPGITDAEIFEPEPEELYLWTR